VAGAILRRIESPEGPATTALVGRQERRLRVGDWRVVYRIDIAARSLTVLRAPPRPCLSRLIACAARSRGRGCD